MSIQSAKVLSEGVSFAGKRALVVGGTAGIGHGIALRLAKAGCAVTIVGRSEERGNAIIDEMTKVSPDSAGGYSHGFTQLDAFDMKACDKFVSDYVATEQPLDVLVLTQGMATTQGFTPTPAEKGGLDEKLTLAVFSRALMAKKLAPTLSNSEDPRVLSVLSAGVHAPFKGYASDPELQQSYSIKNAADASGFYTDLYLDALASEFPKVSFMHAAPGFVNTNWGTEMPTVLRWCIRGLQVFGRSKEDCGELMFKSLFQPAYKGGGLFLFDQHGENNAKVTALHEEAKGPVWAHISKVIENLGSAL